MSWLIGARGRLVDGRPALPPTAWRGALALVDEAIRALAGDQLAVAPVPRLAASALVARAVEPGSRAPASPVERRSRRIAAAASPSPAAGPADRPRLGDAGGERVVYVIATAPAGGLAQAQAPAAPSQDPPREPTSPPRRPTRPPSEPPTTAPTTVPVPPTDTPPPTGVPSVDPSPAPTDTPASPTEVPSPTATAVPVLNKPPVIAKVWCDDTRLLLGKSTTCHVAAYDVEGDTLDYLWTSDVQQMLNERFKDATYFAAWGVGGGVMTVRITVYVSDRGPVGDPTAEGVTRADTFVEVRPPDFFGP